LNEQRLDVGLSAAGISSAAYYASLEYARQRLQGRKVGHKNPTTRQIPIRQDAGVERMLLFQRSTLEGSLALLLQCKNYGGRERLQGEEKKTNGPNLLGSKNYNA
jgi:alkylation response protein AidB-like acyl-CoA dehydrogenase